MLGVRVACSRVLAAGASSRNLYPLYYGIYVTTDSQINNQYTHTHTHTFTLYCDSLSIKWDGVGLRAVLPLPLSDHSSFCDSGVAITALQQDVVMAH